MSWSDQDIDKLFRDAGKPEIPPFQESFWTEMEAMLPEQKRRKVAVWWWAGGAAMVLALLTFGWFVAGSGTDQPLGKQTQTFAKLTLLPVVEAPEQSDFSPVSGIYTEPNISKQKSTKASMPVSRSKTVVQYEQVKFEEDLHPLDAQVTAQAKTQVVEQPLKDLPLITVQFPLASFHPKTPDKPEYKPTRFYVQASAGIGYSARKNVPNSSDLLHCYAIGAGLYKKIDNAVLTLGVQGRIDFVKNVRYTYFPDGTAAKRIDADYHQLYSVEMPASIGIINGRNTFALNVTPGLQAGVFGEINETTNNVLVRSENTFVRVDKKATTLTMEIGCSYLRTISPDWYLGAAVNSDIIGPFNSSSYAGKQRALPVNAQLMLRRTF